MEIAGTRKGTVMTGSSRLTPETARLVQLSSQRLFAVESQFAEAFHQTLDELAPSMHVLPPASGTALTAELAHCVLWAALTQDPPDVVEATVQRVGANIRYQGFPDDAYGGVGHALLRGVRAILTHGWNSELSSAWVAYYLWLDAHLRLGADLVRAQDGAAVGIPAVRATSLDEILQHLRSTYFAENERGLGSICTRVMLRTDADLRAPRPDQRTDPVVIAKVLDSLLLMGFTHAPSSPDSPGSPNGLTPRWRRTFRRLRYGIRQQRLTQTDPGSSTRDRR